MNIPKAKDEPKKQNGEGIEMSTYKGKKNGKDIEVASCTTIISDASDKSGALSMWASNSCRDWIEENCKCELQEGYCVIDADLEQARFHFKTLSKQALDDGSAVHHAIEKHLKGKKVPKHENKQIENAFNAFLKFLDEHEVKTADIEMEIWDENKRWAGTLDWEGELDGKYTVLDWKTSKALYKENHYQVAAYRSTEPEVESCGIVRLDKESGEFQLKLTDKSYEQDLVIFNNMVELYYSRHPRNKKRAGL